MGQKFTRNTIIRMPTDVKNRPHRVIDNKY